MSDFLLFCKRKRVFMKYRFLIYKFQLLKFLGKFIPYFKHMIEFTEEDILQRFNNVLIPHVHKCKNFSINGYPQIESFDYINKSCMILYDMIYDNKNISSIDFQILIKVINDKVSLGLFDDSGNEDIFNFYKYLQSMKDKHLYAEYMKYVKEK